MWAESHSGVAVLFNRMTVMTNAAKCQTRFPGDHHNLTNLNHESVNPSPARFSILVQ